MKLQESLKDGLKTLKENWITPVFVMGVWTVVEITLSPKSLPWDIFCITLAAVGFVISAKFLKLITLGLCLSLATPESRAQSVDPTPTSATGAGVAVGVVVVVVGGIIVIKVIRYCQKFFGKTPENTNAPPPSKGGEGGETTSAERWTGFCGSCLLLAEVSTLPTPTHVQLDVDLENHLGVRIVPQSELVGITEFRNELAPWGLNASGINVSEGWFLGDGWLYYRPESAKTRNVRIETSTDLEHWTQVIDAEIPEGLSLRLEDMSFEPVSYWRIGKTNTPNSTH